MGKSKLSEHQIERRRNRLLAEEARQPIATWWLSFADENGCRGVCLVDAPGFLLAVDMAHLLGINPGGEVQGLEVPSETAEFGWQRNKLFTVDELKAGGCMTIREYEEEQANDSR